ncbi:MAG: hypothetical protein VX874_24555 [Pseudomonadota bacterium]|nr:hypothetical protein [Pseudomonadota bacterium]
MRLFLAAAMPLVLAGCDKPFEPPLAAPLIRAADPATAVMMPSGPTVVHTSRPIAAPEDWRRLNDAQAPGSAS